MKFGEVPVVEAEGAILAHSLKLGTAALKKARVLSRADVELIAAAGLTRIVVARLEDGDIGEDEAARRVAMAAAGAEIEVAAPFTGRADLFAKARGLLVFDPGRLDRLNLVDEAVTLGTLPPFAVVEPSRWSLPLRSFHSPHRRRRSRAASRPPPRTDHCCASHPSCGVPSGSCRHGCLG